MNTERDIPKLYIWKDSRLYIGTNHVPFRHYTLAWSQLLVSIQGEMRIQLADGSEVLTRSCLIKAGTVVNETNINTRNAVIAIYYLNPIAQHFMILQNQMTSAAQGMYYELPEEGLLVQQHRYILKTPLSPNKAYRIFQSAIVQPHVRTAYLDQMKLLNTSLVFQDIERIAESKHSTTVERRANFLQYNTAIMLNHDGQQLG